MPPSKLQEQFSVRTVDSAELEKLKQWIAQGARRVLHGQGEEGYREQWVEHPFPTADLRALEAHG